MVDEQLCAIREDKDLLLTLFSTVAAPEVKLKLQPSVISNLSYPDGASINDAIDLTVC